MKYGNLAYFHKHLKAVSISKVLTAFYILEELCARLESEARLASEARACTGVLGIHPMSKDIKMDNFSVTFHGAELIQDSKVELSCGRKYGLIGVNGSGKSSFLAVLGKTQMIFLPIMSVLK